MQVDEDVKDDCGDKDGDNKEKEGEEKDNAEGTINLCSRGR